MSDLTAAERRLVAQAREEMGLPLLNGASRDGRDGGKLAPELTRLAIAAGAGTTVAVPGLPRLPAPTPVLDTSALDVEAAEALLARLVATYQDQPTYLRMILGVGMLQAMKKRNTHNDRHLKPKWVAKLEQVMRDRRFCLTHQGFAFDATGILRDAQHRIEAAIAAGHPIQTFVCFGLNPRDCDVVDFGEKRKAAELLTRDGVKYASQAMALVRHLERLHSGIELDEQALHLRAKKMLGNPKNYDRSALQRSAAAGQQLKGVVAPTPGGVAYYSILTKSHHADQLSDFWAPLVSGADLRKGHVILQVRASLKIERADRKTWIQHYRSHTIQAGLIISAWNLWVENTKGKPDWKDPDHLPRVV